MRLAPVTSLNGTWRMQPERSGLDRPKGERWCEVPVPMPWSAFLLASSGVPAAMLPQRMAWFKRRVAVPDVPPLSRIVLHFEAVNFYAVVFVNGRRCGEHVGDAIPFDVDITDFVTPRHEAEILVGVQDVSYAEVKSGGPGAAAARKLVFPGLPHHPGIWGGVTLRLIPELHIVRVAARTSLPAVGKGQAGATEGRIHVTVAVKNETGRAVGFSLTNEVYDGARQAIAFAPIRGVVGAGELTEIDMATAWESAALWWPDQPHLYSLRTALWSTLPERSMPAAEAIGDVVDRVHTRIGFREFRMDGDRFLLNRVPIQLRSESVCPVSGQLFSETATAGPVSPIEPEQAQQALLRLKRERGLNAVRFHRIAPNPALLDAADEVGLLAIVEFPLPDDEGRYAVDNPKFWANAEQLARRWVAAHSHHASVVMWSIDQGMVQRYGKTVIDGLMSMARTVAEVDPTRMVEHAGDAGMVDGGEPPVPGPLSVFFPATGVALRSTGAYAADVIRDRLLPQTARRATPWLPPRPTDRPLCMLEHARRSTSPNALAFFLGDAAYAGGIAVAESVAALAALEMGACRMTRLSAIHTIGRPAPTPGSPNATADVVALPKCLFANFYAGTRFVENLALRNDTRFDQDCDLVCQFTTADSDTAEHSEELLMPAGSQEEKSISFELPDIRKVHDAASARSVLAEFSVMLKGTRAGSFAHRRKVAVWPHVRATGNRRIGLVDPEGQTAAALSAVGAKYAAAHGAPHREFDTIIVGENALERGPAPDSDALRSFVGNGGLAIFLAQRRMPYDLSPVTLIVDEEHAASITFVRDAEHYLLQGLSDFEMRWWQDDHRVATGCFRKPASGNFRCLVDAGGPGGLRWAAAVEVFHGRGSYIFSQMELVEKAARAPIAGLLLARLADAVPSWRAVAARRGGPDELFSSIGADCPALPADFAGADLEKVQVVLLAGETAAALSGAQLYALQRWVQQGGCLYMHNLAPGQERVLTAVSGQEVRLVASPQERLVFSQPGSGLARGLSSADLYFADHGARQIGEAPRRVHAATTIASARGNVLGAASTPESSLEYALFTLHTGKGRVVVDQVRWDVETRADSRSGRYASTLLTNLGVLIPPPSGVLPSANCEPVDISNACNATLSSYIPGDRTGWTGRGPDSDLGAFSPGLLIAGGVPFRVGRADDRTPRNCCVLGADGAQAAGPIELGRPVPSLAFLVACEGHVKHGTPIGHFTVRYADGLETQIPLRYGIDILDWNERARPLQNASVAWKGFTAIGEPAVTYARRWSNNRASVPVKGLVFSTARTGATPILLALTALK